MRRFLMGFQTVAAVGIVAWWVYWFASGANHHGSACALAYENSFPIADLVLAAALGRTAVALHRREDTAVWVAGGLAAGMAFSLATLDTTHNLLTGGFSGPVATTLRKALFAVVNGSVGALTLVFLNRGDAGVAPPLPDGSRIPLAMAAGLVLPLALAYQVLGDGCAGALALSFVGAGVLLETLALGVLQRRGASWSLVLLGALLHTALVAGLHLLV